MDTKLKYESILDFTDTLPGGHKYEINFKLFCSVSAGYESRCFFLVNCYSRNIFFYTVCGGWARWPKIMQLLVSNLAQVYSVPYVTLAEFQFELMVSGY